MFELSQLRCFVIVAEELHFGRAATRLHMTQPPLSRQIQMLEHLLDAQLLERSSRNVSLTRAGRGFLPQARMILKIAEDASVTTRRIARGETGTITVGFTASTGYRFLPSLVASCREQLPEINLRLKEMVTMEQIEALSSGFLDIALARLQVTSDEFEAVCIERQTLMVALPETHSLATGRQPTLGDFDGIPFVMYAPLEARYFHDLVTSIFVRAGVHPDYIQYCSQIHTILGLVRAGLGVALVPEIATLTRFDGVVFRPVRKMRPARPVELFLVWKRSNDNPALRSVLDQCLLQGDPVTSA